jgi:riboflavin synthase
MFTGIIETLGVVKNITKEATNIHFTIQSNLATELKIDQSVAHNGVCLTVTHTNHQNLHTVTAISETLQKTNLGLWEIGTSINLERCTQLNGRLDGHLVQGHTDQTAICIQAEDKNGSWLFSFQYDETSGNITVEKGSICINGVSLTVVNSQKNTFLVAIIPYTYQHTNFKDIQEGSKVNLEFDIIGKYLQKMALGYFKPSFQ